jgi:hypothetical protein
VPQPAIHDNNSSATSLEDAANEAKQEDRKEASDMDDSIEFGMDALMEEQ